MPYEQFNHNDIYNPGDIVLDPATGVPYRCIAPTGGSRTADGKGTAARAVAPPDPIIWDEISPRFSRSLGDGTVAAPAISFASDPDTGLIRGGEDRLDIILGGILRATFISNVQTGLSGHTYPLTDGVYDLGYSPTAFRWRDLSLSRQVNVAGLKVLGARGGAVANAVAAVAAPTQAEFNALVTQFNLLLARLRLATGHGLIYD